MTDHAKNFWLGRELRALGELEARVKSLEVEAGVLGEVAASSAQIAAAAARLQQGLERARADHAALKQDLESAAADHAAAAQALAARIDDLDARGAQEAARLSSVHRDMITAVQDAAGPLSARVQEDRGHLAALSARAAQIDAAAADRSEALAARLDVVRARLDEETGRLTEGVDDLTARAAAEAARLDVLAQDVEAARQAAAARLAVLTGRADGADARLDGLDGRADAAETRLGGLDVRADTAQTRLGGLDARADTAQTRLGGLDARADMAQTRLDGLDGRADAAADKLSELDSRTQSVEALSGDQDRFRDAAARVLSESLRRAGAAQPERLSNALSPYIVNSIRAEIRNSREEMVQALQPIVGRLVRAAVAAALFDLNKQIENSLPFERWITAVKARISGKDALAYMAEETFEIVEILVIERPSGVLIARHAPSGEDTRVDQDLMSGMLSTVLSFTEDALAREDGDSLRTLEMTDSTFYLRAAPATILALRATGPAPDQFDTALDALFDKFLERWDAIKDLNPGGDASQIDAYPLLEDLEAKAGGVVTAAEEKKKPRYMLMGAIAVLIPLCGWLGSLWIDHVFEQTWVRRVEATLAAQPETFALPMNVGFSEGRITVRGLAATSADAAQLQTVLRALPSPYPIEATLRALDRPALAGGQTPP